MLEAHADYLQVADQVRFLGAVSDEVLHRWLRTASVIATLKEASLWGGTLLTAVCAGVPIIASDIPANREAVALTIRVGIEFVSLARIAVRDRGCGPAPGRARHRLPRRPRAELGERGGAHGFDLRRAAAP
jgi:Glycosyl transferases group 1